MPDGSVGAGLQQSPLSNAFRQAWLEWLVAWNGLSKDDEDVARQVGTVVEFSTKISRKLWRSAFASVGDSAEHQVKATVYAFVALVDETLLYAVWPGQPTWQSDPLESLLYASRHAGEHLPQAIEKLLADEIPASRDLANVYLQCLILGFHGRLRGEAGLAQHEKWRHALFAFAWQHDPDYVDVSDCLERPSNVPARRLPIRQSLPDGWRLGLVILGVTLVMIGISHYFWYDINQEAQSVIHQANPDEPAEQNP
ncbi:DotU/TssL family secretion system protein [Pseudomonas batumici]|uniref:DotU family type IV/VI secretion system protein n=1 Tax=Pseudomonas batumici TaxID=226910 RepID=UPI0030D165C4